MARPGTILNSKDDDDSWGKLASDLLGINLQEAPDLDFPEPEPPPAPAASPPQEVVAVSEPAATEESAESDATEPAEEIPVSREKMPVSEAVEPAQDDYWNALESWNWEEASASAKTERREEGRTRSRGDRLRRDRGDRRGGRDRTESGRRADRPLLEEPPLRCSRDDRASAVQNPTRERPEVRTRSEKPPQKSAPKKVCDDDFAAGLFEDATAEETDVWPQEADAAPAPRRSAAPVDDFAGDLLDDDAEVTAAETSASDDREGVADAEERPRRRRRRRRRRGGSRPAESLSSEDLVARPQTDDEFDTDVESEPAPSAAAGQAGEDAESEVARPRRRRRRRRRSSEERVADARPSSSVSADADDIEEPVADEPQHIAVERPRIGISYEDIPTWDEAISYLVTRSREAPRSGGDRERHGPRRPARRPPRDDAGDVD